MFLHCWGSWLLFNLSKHLISIDCAKSPGGVPCWRVSPVDHRLGFLPLDVSSSTFPVIIRRSRLSVTLRGTWPKYRITRCMQFEDRCCAFSVLSSQSTETTGGTGCLWYSLHSTSASHFKDFISLTVGSYGPLSLHHIYCYY